MVGLVIAPFGSLVCIIENFYFQIGATSLYRRSSRATVLHVHFLRLLS